MDFSKHIQKAEEAERRRNYDFAVELYQQLLDIDADQGDARSGLRRVLKKRHESKKGSRLLRAIGGAAPLASAKALRKAGRNEAAAKSLEKYLATNPMDEAANLLLGMCLEDAGHYKSARAVYEFLADIAPKSPEGLKRAGAMMARTGDPHRALEYYERALEADPRDQEAIRARKDLAAETALSKTNYDKVQHSREQIVDKEGARSIERSQRLHQTTEDLEAELERLQGLFAENSSDPDLMIQMAAVHEKLKDPEAALDLVERALSYRKDSHDLQQRVGELNMKVLKRGIAKASKLGDDEKAQRLEEELWKFEIDELKRRVTVHPGDAALRIQLGRRLLRAGSLDEAVGELQKSVNDPRSQAEAYFLLGRCFQEKGFLDLARTEYSKALDLRGSTDDRAKEILYNLGAIAEAEGDPAEARSLYSKIFQIDIGYRDVAQKMEQFR